jgi:hypothetical protein
MAKQHAKPQAPRTIAEALNQSELRYTPGGLSAYDQIMARAKELFPQPIARPPASDYPWQGALDEAMAAAPDVSPAAIAAARIEVGRARMSYLQGWLGDRQPTFRSRGLEASLLGVTDLQLRCFSCGAIWLIPLDPIATMVRDEQMLCPNGCNCNS